MGLCRKPPRVYPRVILPFSSAESAGAPFLALQASEGTTVAFIHRLIQPS